MNNFFSFLVAFGIYFPIAAQNTSTTITAARNARHIVRITSDSIIIVKGNTYAFTVDTPEDQGLVSTTPTAAILLSEVGSKIGSDQLYRFMSRDGKFKT